MDSDGLPIVGPGIDYRQVGAIHQKRTLAFVNHFVSHTTQFLNRFSCVCEEKLEALAFRLQRLETTMHILEAKLSSIPGLENIIPPDDSAETPTPTQLSPINNDIMEPSTNTAIPTNEAESEPCEPTRVSTRVTVTQDTRYAPFFRMTQVGVPMPAVKQKMVAEGLNPDLLDTPHAAAPPGGGISDDLSGGEGNDTSSIDDEIEDSSSNSSVEFSD